MHSNDFAKMPPRVVTEWFSFRDGWPKDDACITVYVENHRGEDPTDCRPQMEITNDLTFSEGKLYDPNWQVVDIDPMAQNVIWSYWPNLVLHADGQH